MDCMLFEGPKVLLRISLTLVHFYTKSKLKIPRYSSTKLVVVSVSFRSRTRFSWKFSIDERILSRNSSIRWSAVRCKTRMSFCLKKISSGTDKQIFPIQSHENILLFSLFVNPLFSFFVLFQVAFRIRNFKQRQINQLIDHEEELLRNNRHQSPMETIQENHHRQSSVEQQTFLPQIPDKSILDHQQVGINEQIFHENCEIDRCSFWFYGIGYQPD